MKLCLLLSIGLFLQFQASPQLPVFPIQGDSSSITLSPALLRWMVTDDKPKDPNLLNDTNFSRLIDIFPLLKAPSQFIITRFIISNSTTAETTANPSGALKFISDNVIPPVPTNVFASKSAAGKLVVPLPPVPNLIK